MSRAAATARAGAIHGHLGADFGPIGRAALAVVKFVLHALGAEKMGVDTECPLTDSGVVDEDINAAPTLHGFSNHVLHLLEVSNVRTMRHCLSTSRFDFSHHCLR